ncbi:MAG: hypothetical protein ACHQ6T_05815 [Myxococcota bacterium]
MHPKAFPVVALALALSLSAVARASDVSSYMKLEGVAGESTPPSLTNAIAIDPLLLDPNGFSITKRIDSTSLALSTAEVTANPFSSATLYFYDDVLTDSQPDASLVLHTALISSITPVTLGSDPGERVAFATLSPTLSLFLELSGLSGESSAPGHPGVIAVDSILLSGNGFSVLKTVDSTSSALLLAAISANPFASATLLVYQNVLSETKPDLEFIFQRALVSSVSSAPSSGEILKENAAFVAQGVTVVPEPTGLSTLAAGLVAVAALWRARHSARRARARLTSS